MKRVSQAATELLNSIISFWKNLEDPVYGGYYGYVGQDLIPQKRADKGCILNSRILWFFSEAAMLLEREDLRQCAHHAYRFLIKHCLDRENGGVFWSIHYDGTPADTTKHTYNQAFAIYGLSAYYRLTGAQEALDHARALFRVVEEHCRDSAGYCEAFTAAWMPESNEKLSENGVLADKTMNTLLHVFEGYAGLYQASGDVEASNALRRILSIYQDKIFDYERRCQKVFFDKDYHSILDIISFGHDIESSWLLDWGCRLLNDDALSRTIEAMNEEMAVAVYERAYVGQSVLNECERGVVDTTRVWWVQTESVLGFLNLWGKRPTCVRYRDAAADIFRYICDYFVDKRPGSEWFWCLDAQNRPISGKPIVEPWKCPYHNGRMCMELIRKDPEIYV